MPTVSNHLLIDKDEQNVTKDILRDQTDDSNAKTSDKSNNSDNCNEEDDLELNKPNTFDNSSKEGEPSLDKQQTRRHNQI